MFEATYIHLDLVNDMDMNLNATTYRSTYLQCFVREWMWKTVNPGWSLIQSLWINPGDRFHEENPIIFQHTCGKYPKRPYPTVYVWEFLNHLWVWGCARYVQGMFGNSFQLWVWDDLGMLLLYVGGSLGRKHVKWATKKYPSRFYYTGWGIGIPTIGILSSLHIW